MSKINKFSKNIIEAQKQRCWNLLKVREIPGKINEQYTVICTRKNNIKLNIKAQIVRSRTIEQWLFEN